MRQERQRNYWKKSLKTHPTKYLFQVYNKHKYVNKVSNVYYYLAPTANRKVLTLPFYGYTTHVAEQLKVTSASIGDNTLVEVSRKQTKRKGVGKVSYVTYVSDTAPHNVYKVYLKGGRSGQSEVNAIRSLSTHEWIPVVQ